MTNERHEQLYALFKAIGKDLVMDRFDDRLEVQKISYMAQSYGIKLDYHFTWYLRGPYSRLVAEDGFEIQKMRDENRLPDIQEHFKDDKQVQRFRNIIKPHMNDPTWLEIAASIIYLKNKQYKNEPLDQAAGDLIADMSGGYKNFAGYLVRDVLADLIDVKLLK